jgi:hypothetical protein
MSALLNMNQKPLIQWKGSTFNQIHSFVKFNNPADTNSLHSLFKPKPLKIYRREIASSSVDVCNPRTSIKIDSYNRPNGTIINSTATTINGLVNLVDNLLPNNSCEEPGTCSVILNPADNARKRVRSGGMIRRQFDISKNNDTYYTSTQQYLSSRNRTFNQNQYNYFRAGDSTAKPGTALASANVYSPQGLSHCAKYHISTATKLSYIWINNTTYDVLVPAGSYTVDDINNLLKQTMFANKHFILQEGNLSANEYYNGNIRYFLNISFNSNTNLVELQSYRTTFAEISGNVPVGATWIPPINGQDKFPQFNLTETPILDALGFSEITFPSTQLAGSITDLVLTESSSVAPAIQKLYVKLYYKPNNPQFARQGAVSAGDLITRKKYNSITNSTVAYRTAFGDSVANALAYGVPSNGYTFKDKLGYPLKKTPTFSKYSDEMKQCTVSTFANAI